MTKRIIVLSEDVANQIAAGEVVERPASIVKELVENALDAGASEIRVALGRGGGESIRVTDNGSGIEREDVAMVFERHATSKISRLDDLYRVGSFGFRGEAMASIASVARVELLTRRPEDLAGTRALIQAGFIVEIAPAGLPSGTQITVTELFANVPARRKFLKTEATEQAACLDAVTRLALAHPEVRFLMTADGREVLTAPVVKDVSERIAMVMGRDFASHCRTITAQKEQVRLRGFISTPDWTRSNSRSIFLYVNSRFIRDLSLTHAVLSAYRQVIEPRRYPAAVLFIDLPGEDVDVNVHPAKLEVRFKNSRDIYELAATAVAQGLAAGKMPDDALAYRLKPREDASAASGFWKPGAAALVKERPAEIYSRRNLQQAIDNDWLTRTLVPAERPQNDVLSPETEPITFSNRTYLGQFAGTYLVFGGPDGVTFLDQHAAHERILLERLKASAASGATGQSLLLPEVVSLSPAQVSLFEEALPLLHDIGLEIDIFGRDALAVKAVPAAMTHVPPADIISDLADQLAGGETNPSLDERREKILASLACRGAIKANASLCAEEVAALCRDLEKTPFNATCPHGRPVSVQFSLYEIERLFKRR